MASGQNLEIRPAPPDADLGALLALTLARLRPLEAGNRAGGVCEEGEWIAAAAIRGSLIVITNTRDTLLQPGQVLLFQEVGAYDLQAVSGCLCGAVQFRGELAGRLLGDCPPLTGGAAILRETVLALSVLENEHAPVDGAAASSRAYDLLVRLTRLSPEGPDVQGSPLAEAAAAIIREEFPFLEGLDELAERLEVSKPHLIRAFTRQTGIPPGKYITKVRIEYAKLLLSSEEASVTYAAEASGFANANYFAKVFRRETGMSPSEFLESAPRRREPGRHPGPPVW